MSSEKNNIFENCFLMRQDLHLLRCSNVTLAELGTAAGLSSQRAQLVQKTFLLKASYNTISHFAGDWQSTFLLYLNKYDLCNDFLAF